MARTPSVKKQVFIMMENENQYELIETLHELMAATKNRKRIEKPPVVFRYNGGWHFDNVAYGYGNAGEGAAKEARRNWKPSQPENDIDNVL